MKNNGIVWLMVVLIVLGSVAVGPLSMQAQTTTIETCQTGYSIAPEFEQFLAERGGVEIFGCPIGPLQEEYIGIVTSLPLPEGAPAPELLLVQRFERARLEFDKNSGAVRVGRLGADILEQQGRLWYAEPSEPPIPGCRYFPNTGRNVCGPILRAWDSYGGLEILGYPLTSEQDEAVEDGRVYRVQWFERARLQYVQSSTAPFGVVLGRLGLLDQCANIPVPINATVQPGICLVSGRNRDDNWRLTLPATNYGFNPGAQVEYWRILPDGSVTRPQLEQNFFIAGDDGTVNPVVSFRFSTGGGIAYFVSTGASPTEGQRNASVLFFKIIEPGPVDLNRVAIQSNPCNTTSLPPRANANAYPVQEYPDGTRERISVNGVRITRCAPLSVSSLELEAYGFVGGETVYYTLINPQGESVSQQQLTTNADGQVINPQTGLYPLFDANAYRAIPGLYTIVMEGTVPRRKSEGEVGVPNLAVIPIRIVAENVVPLNDATSFTRVAFQQQIEIGQSVNGNIAFPEEVHTWTFKSGGNENITIDVIAKEGSPLDPIVDLLDPFGLLISSDDDSGGNLNSRLETLLDLPGIYTIRIRSFGAESQGEYTLRLTGTAQAEAEAVERGFVELNSAVQDELGQNQRHVWAIAGEAGQTVQIDVIAMEGSPLDPIVDLFFVDATEGPQLIAVDDDGGEGFNSQIILELPITGFYYVRVRSFGNTFGPYILQVTTP